MGRYSNKLCFDGCTLCSGCRERVYDWDKFPRDCKVRKEVESNINKQLLPSLKWAESFGTEQLKKWIIQENKRFEALQLEHNTEVVQLNERKNVYWCSVNYLLWSDKRTIEVLNEELRKIEQAERQAAEPQQVAMKHYNSKDEEAKLKRLFEELKKEGYFDKKADVETWLYICGINDKIIPQKPLNWISDNGLLAHLIKALFLQDYNKWSIASKCFTVKGGTPKPNVLSKLDSVGFHMKNKRHQRLDEILKSCGL
jgi:hypothetical protein